MTMRGVLIYSLTFLLVFASGKLHINSVDSIDKQDDSSAYITSLRNKVFTTHLLAGRVGSDEGSQSLLESFVELGINSAIPALLSEIPTMEEFNVTLDEIAKLSGSVGISSTGLSALVAGNLKLYLATRQAAMDFTLPSLELEGTLNVDSGSWISPLNIPLHGPFIIRATASDPLTFGFACKLDVTNNTLIVEKIGLDPGLDSLELTLETTDEESSLTENPNLNLVVNKIIAELQSRLIVYWTPVVQNLAVKIANKVLTVLQSPYES